MPKFLPFAVLAAALAAAPAQAEIVSFTGVADAFFVPPGAIAPTSTASFSYTPSTTHPDGFGGYVVRADSGTITFSGLLSIGGSLDTTTFDAALMALYLDYDMTTQRINVGTDPLDGSFIISTPRNADGFALYNPQHSGEDSLTQSGPNAFGGAYFTNMVSAASVDVPEPPSVLMLSLAILGSIATMIRRPAR